MIRHGRFGLLGLAFGCVLCVVPLSACRTAPPQPVNAFTLEVNVAADVPPGEIYFKPIPGGFAGKSADVELPRPQSDGTVTIPPLLQALARHAEPLGSNPATNPVELIRPSETRVARLGTFYAIAQADGGCNNTSTGLRDKRAASHILLYVDRGATIIGTRYAQPYIYDYRLDFPERGVYLIALHRSGYVIEPRIATADETITADVRRAPCAPAFASSR